MMGRTHATSGAVLALATMPLLRKYGLSADPKVEYDICVTVNDVTAAGTISMKVELVQ